MSSKEGLLNEFHSILHFLLGSIIIAFSAGTGITYAFKSNFLVVYLCFVTLIIGYKISQVGYHNGRKSHTIFLKDIKKLKNQKTNVISFVAGSIFTSLGFLLLGKAVIQTSLIFGLSAGIVIGGGYIISHWAVNNRLV